MNPVKIPLGATALLPLAVSTATAQETGASSKPNFVFIMTDQQRADLCGREGYPLDVTPFVDRMAGEGVWFDRAYTPAPISGPARVAFLTGRFPKATRVKSNHNIEDAVYKDDLFSFARRNGYRTALVGKNHAHLKPQNADCWRPYNHFAQQGRVDEKAKAFNRYLGTTDMYADYDPAPFGPEMQHPWRMVDDALAWIGNGDDKPFMMWLSFPEPHNPYQVSEPYYSMFPPEKLPPMRTDIRDLAVKGPEYELLHEMMSLGHAGYYEHLGRLRSNYHGMIRLIDDQIARFVEQLRKEGLYENTVFVVMSDHGDFAGEYGLMKKGQPLSAIPWFPHRPPGDRGGGSDTDASVLPPPGRFPKRLLLCVLYPSTNPAAVPEHRAYGSSELNPGSPHGPSTYHSIPAQRDWTGKTDGNIP